MGISAPGKARREGGMKVERVNAGERAQKEEINEIICEFCWLSPL